MGCNCDQTGTLGSWTGIVDLHTKTDKSLSLDNGVQVALGLRSYKKENNRHIYEMTIAALQIVNQEIYSKITYDVVSTNSGKFATQETELTVENDNSGIGIKNLKAVIASEENVTVLTQDSDTGYYKTESKNVELLTIKATVDIFGVETTVSGQSPFEPLDCFRIERKCIHDTCTTWGVDYPCRYRCVSRACGNRGCNNVPWTETGESCLILPCTL